MVKVSSYKSEKMRYLVSAIFVLFLMSLTWLFVPLHFETNDDVGIMYIVAGYRTGTPSPISLYTGAIFGYMLSGLYALFPMIPWYGITHIAFLFISFVMILKSFLRIAVQKGLSPFIPLSLFFFLYTFFLFYYTVTLQFTTTPAMMGAAACILTASLFCEESKNVRVFDSVAIVLMFFLAYTFRPGTGIAVIPYFSLIIVFKAAVSFIEKSDCTHRIRWHSYALIGSSIAVLLVSSTAFDTYIAGRNGMSEFSSFNTQRSKFMDFRFTAYEDAPELYEGIGWDRELYHLVRSWFFIDERVTKENFTILNEYYSATQEELTGLEYVKSNTKATSETIRNLIVADKVAMSATFVFLVGFLIHIIMLIKQKKWYHLIFIVALITMLLFACLYLGYKGRFILRVYFATLIPAASLLFWDIVYACPAGKLHAPVKLFSSVLAVFLFIGFMLTPFRTAYTRAKGPAYNEDAHRRLAMERYVSEHSENIYVYEVRLSGLVPVFTLYGEQKPYNLFSWGGAGMFSPVHDAQLKANQLDALYTSTMLNANCYFLCLNFEGATINSFIQQMEQRYDATPLEVDVVNGIHVIQFVQN